MRAYVVVDLGFGDSGKGLLTDFLARHFESDLVVRYNGGAQAGHNVVTPDGIHHTFSQFGSGTFIPHVKTYLSRHVVIHPTALLIEGDVLEKKGVSNPFSRLRVSDQALVITPFHQATNRIREIIRGANRHGSCGVGVGEVVEDALLHTEDRILASDLNNPVVLQRKLKIIRERKREQITGLCKENAIDSPPPEEWAIFEQNNVIDTWISTVARITELGIVTSDSVLENWLHESKTVVFEGAQGVLLDEDLGFHPYTTWSRCTTANALDLINEMMPDSEVHRIGVMRSFLVRHGPGPLPTETEELKSIGSEHNKRNEWQGVVRYGWFDAVLARYALEATSGVDSLAVTHLDMLSKLEAWKYSPGYEEMDDFHKTTASTTISDGVLKGFLLSKSLSLEEREQFTQVLSKVTPVLSTCKTDDKTVIQAIESLTKYPVEIISHGPSADNMQILDAF